MLSYWLLVFERWVSCSLLNQAMVGYFWQNDIVNVDIVVTIGCEDHWMFVSFYLLVIKGLCSFTVHYVYYYF